MRGSQTADHASSPSATLLHVTSGDAAADTLRRTGLGGAVLPWRDVLHEGPVPALPRGQLLRTRARFLAGCGWGSEPELLASLERRDRQLLQAFRDRARVVLWFERDLYDQLQLLDVLALARAAAAGAAPELIVAGLGEAAPSRLETLWNARRRADPAALQEAASAWAALQAPAPEPLAALAGRPAEHLPHLTPALLRLLEELPAPRDGLSGTERRALDAIAGGATTPHAAFLAAQRGEDAPYLGDAWFFRALTALGQGESRLVETGDGTALPPPPPLGDGTLFARLRLRLTELGRRTLRGDADRVALLGLDRWIGGTHATAERAWRWDPTARRLLPP